MDFVDQREEHYRDSFYTREDLAAQWVAEMACNDEWEMVDVYRLNGPAGYPFDVIFNPLHSVVRVTTFDREDRITHETLMDIDDAREYYRSLMRDGFEPF